MNAPARLPENILTDIGIYLAPGEKIIKALSPFTSGKTGAGQVWLILTSQSIIFHTCETKKEPLVALLARNEIKEIEYFQRPGEITLTFIPTRNTQKTSRLTFNLAKQEELEDFCEDLADLINFKKETTNGVKSYITPKTLAPALPSTKPADQKPSSINESELRHAASSIRHANQADAATKTDSPPLSSRKPELVAPPEVKIVTPSPAPVVPPFTNMAGAASKDSGELKVGYFIVATLISVLVAFIWYKFFSSIASYGSSISR